MKKIFYIAMITIILAACRTSGDSVKEIGMMAGLKLWEQNCNRCHNAPAPNTFNDDEWEVVGAHMRLRAGLTSYEVKEIIGFLKTLN